ncbi:MAG: hypothetical protein WCV92_00945 [Candidatus Buchananbacteria bacterium]
MRDWIRSTTNYLSAALGCDSDLLRAGAHQKDESAIVRFRFRDWVCHFHLIFVEDKWQIRDSAGDFERDMAIVVAAFKS